MKEKLKIPILCKIKRIITIPSSSASIFCEYGYRFRPYKWCKKCPKNFKSFDFANFLKNS